MSNSCTLQNVVEFAEKRMAERLAAKRQFVYVLGCDGFVKIGIAADPIKRLRACQTGNPHSVEFLGMFPTITPRIDEENLHRQFEEFHKLGEWFKLNEWRLAKLLRKACYRP